MLTIGISKGATSMVIAEKLITDLDTFRGDMDAVFKLRGSLVPDSRDAQATEVGVDAAYKSSVAFHNHIIQFDLDIRRKCWNAEIEDREFEELDASLGYLCNLWHSYTKQLLAISDARAPRDERLEHLTSLVSEMESILRSREDTERVMGPTAKALEASALEESRSGQTLPIL